MMVSSHCEGIPFNLKLIDLKIALYWSFFGLKGSSFKGPLIENRKAQRHETHIPGIVSESPTTYFQSRSSGLVEKK